jgi:hypothetical protein
MASRQHSPALRFLCNTTRKKKPRLSQKTRFSTRAASRTVRAIYGARSIGCKNSHFHFDRDVQRSAAAAKEIKALIDDSVEKVEIGSKLVADAGTTMDEMVNSIQRVTDIMAEITAASQEQSAGIE